MPWRSFANCASLPAARLHGWCWSIACRWAMRLLRLGSRCRVQVRRRLRCVAGWIWRGWLLVSPDAAHVPEADFGNMRIDLTANPARVPENVDFSNATIRLGLLNGLAH